MGRKFFVSFASLPGFGNVTTFDSLKSNEKCDSRKQCLNKCVMCSSGLLGRCLKIRLEWRQFHRPLQF